MIDKLYGKYFQKSKSFLYPILGIKRTSFNLPIGTYISLKGIYEPEDMRFICTFKENDTQSFKDFEEQMLLTNPLFIEKIKLKDFSIYVFDMEVYYEDWFNFIMGKYSKLSNVTKKAIRAYYGEKSKEYKYIETYIYPEKYFETYATLLEVSIYTLKKIGELCNPCDLEKENLKIPIEDLGLIEKK